MIGGHVGLRRDDGAFIPYDEGNRDYQEYLAWVAEGNTAEEWTVLNVDLDHVPDKLVALADIRLDLSLVVDFPQTGDR